MEGPANLCRATLLQPFWYNPSDAQRLCPRPGPLRTGGPFRARPTGGGARLLHAAGPHALREFLGRFAAPAPAVVAAVPHGLRLLPLGRRPGRRDRRRPAGAG